MDLLLSGENVMPTLRRSGGGRSPRQTNLDTYQLDRQRGGCPIGGLIVDLLLSGENVIPTFVAPAEAGVQAYARMARRVFAWIPAYAGTTVYLSLATSKGWHSVGHHSR